jgi:hypothetical protein
MGVKMNSQRGKNMAYVKSVKAISELMVWTVQLHLISDF